MSEPSEPASRFREFCSKAKLEGAKPGVNEDLYCLYDYSMFSALPALFESSHTNLFSLAKTQ
jgi:hypothetical protein